MPLYVLGLMGMTRRMQHYDVAEWHPWLLVAGVGALIILTGIGVQIAQLVVSIRHREELRDTTGDPWDGRTAGMGDVLAAAAVQFRRAAAPDRRRGLTGHEGARSPAGAA